MLRTLICFFVFAFSSSEGTPPFSSSTFAGLKPFWDKGSEKTKVETEAVPSGTQAKLMCKAFGNPEPIVKWFRNGKLLTNDSRRELNNKYGFKRYSLVFDDSLPSDSDMYKCTAENEFGSLSREIRLRVEERIRSRPIIDPYDPKNVTVYVGSRAEFECKIMSPSGLIPNIMWLFSLTATDEPRQVFSDVFPKEYLDIEKRYRPVTNKFVIVNTTLDHEGYYACKIGNQFGSSKRGAYLTILQMSTTDKTENVTVPPWNLSTDNVDDQNLFFVPINDPSPTSTKEFKIAIGIFVSVAVVVIIFIVAFVCYRKNRFKRKGRNNTNGRDVNNCFNKRLDSCESTGDSKFGDVPNRKISGRYNNANSPLLLNEFSEWQKDYKDLRFGQEIGSGVGGIVCRGKLQIRQTGKKFYSAVTETDVAIKEINRDRSQSLRMLEDELSAFIRIGPHPNILKLYGYCTGVEPFCIVFEYCANGDLKNYLKNHRRRLVADLYENSDRYERPTIDARPTIDERHLIEFCLEISKGMKHMTEKNCIHRDLAARNILLTRDNVVKICDFGLAKVLSDEYYYRTETNKMLPVRWMAPEVLATDCFTYENDVWAFGVCMWEIFSFGAKPYEDELGSCDLTVYNYLQSGRRLKRPLGCREDVYKIMRRCWSQEPLHRPTFAQIVDLLIAIKAAVMSEPYLDVIE